VKFTDRVSKKAGSNQWWYECLESGWRLLVEPLLDRGIAHLKARERIYREHLVRKEELREES